MAERKDGMIFDDYYADCEYWCPLCGDPREICDSYGSCAKWEQGDEDNGRYDCYDESWEEIYGGEE